MYLFSAAQCMTKKEKKIIEYRIKHFVIEVGAMQIYVSYIYFE